MLHGGGGLIHVANVGVILITVDEQTPNDFDEALVTLQAPDRFVFREQEVEILCFSGERIFHPADYGLRGNRFLNWLL